jgi:hypothetical protein
MFAEVRLGNRTVYKFAAQAATSGFLGGRSKHPADETI